MQKALLFTQSEEYVATVEIPAFKTDPDVILWGSRVFKLWQNGTQLKYIECFAVAAIKTID